MFLWYLFLLRLFAVELCIFLVFSQAKIRTLGLVKKCFCWCFLWWYFLLSSYVFLQFSLKPKVRNSDPWLSMLLLMFLVMRFFCCASCRFLQFPLKPRLRNSDRWLNMILWFFWWIFFSFWVVYFCILLSRQESEIRTLGLVCFWCFFFLVVRVWTLMTKDGIV